MNKRVTISIISSLFLNLLNGSLNASALADGSNPSSTEMSSTSSQIQENNSSTSSGQTSVGQDVYSPSTPSGQNTVGQDSSSPSTPSGQNTVGQDVYSPGTSQSTDTGGTTDMNGGSLNSNSSPGMGNPDSSSSTSPGQNTVEQNVYQQQDSTGTVTAPNPIETQVENNIDQVVSKDGNASTQDNSSNGNTSGGGLDSSGTATTGPEPIQSGGSSGIDTSNPGAGSGTDVKLDVPDANQVQKNINDLVLMLKQEDLAETDGEAEIELKEMLKLDLDRNQINPAKIEILTSLEMKDNQGDQAKQDIDAAILKNPKDDSLYSVLKTVMIQTKDTESVKVYINGQKPQFDVQPYLQNDHLLVPVRSVMEALGAKVSWNEMAQTATIQTDKVSLELPLESTTIRVNGQDHRIETALEEKDNRVMVPIRFVSEYLGLKVSWDARTNIVIIK